MVVELFMWHGLGFDYFHELHRVLDVTSHSFARHLILGGKDWRRKQLGIVEFDMIFGSYWPFWARKRILFTLLT